MDTNENTENQEANLIQNCGFVISADWDAQTMLINIATEITSDGDEKETRLEDYEYEYYEYPEN